MTESIIIVIFYGFCDGAVSFSDCVTLNGRVFGMNDALKIISKKVGVA